MRFPSKAGESGAGDTESPAREIHIERPARPAVTGWRAALTIVFAVALYMGAALPFVRSGTPNADEGFYANIAAIVHEGRMPYRDFAYMQMPLMPYLNGTVMQFTGFGVERQRMLSLGWSTLTVALVVALWLRLGLRIPAVAGLMAVWCSQEPLLYFHSIGKTYAVVQLLLVAMAWCFVWRRSPRRRLIVLSLLGTLAVGCRGTAAPAVVLCWAAFAWMHRRDLSLTVMVGIPALAGVALIGPFFVADWHNAWFWNLEYHLASTLERDGLRTTLDALGNLRGIAVVAAFAGILAVRKRIGGFAPLVAAATILGGLACTAGIGLFDEYVTPFAPVLLLACGGILATAASWRTTVIVCAIAAGLSFTRTEPWRWNHSSRYLESIAKTSDFVRSISGPDDVILTPMPEIPLESGRPNAANLELGKFGITVELSDERAERLHMLTFRQVAGAVGAKHFPIVVLSRSGWWNFRWTLPSVRGISAVTYRSFAAALATNYRCVYFDDSFVVFMRDPGERKTYDVTVNDLMRVHEFTPR